MITKNQDGNLVYLLQRGNETIELSYDEADCVYQAMRAKYMRDDIEMLIDEEDSEFTNEGVKLDFSTEEAVLLTEEQFDEYVTVAVREYQKYQDNNWTDGAHVGLDEAYRQVVKGKGYELE